MQHSTTSLVTGAHAVQAAVATQHMTSTLRCLETHDCNYSDDLGAGLSYTRCEVSPACLQSDMLIPMCEGWCMRLPALPLGSWGPLVDSTPTCTPAHQLGPHVRRLTCVKTSRQVVTDAHDSWSFSQGSATPPSAACTASSFPSCLPRAAQPVACNDDGACGVLTSLSGAGSSESILSCRQSSAQMWCPGHTPGCTPHTALAASAATPSAWL